MKYKDTVPDEVKIVPKGFPQRTDVVAICDGEEIRVFSYYPDELSFTKKELEGKTIQEMQELYFQKDLQYLQS